MNEFITEESIASHAKSLSWINSEIMPSSLISIILSEGNSKYSNEELHNLKILELYEIIEELSIDLEDHIDLISMLSHISLVDIYQYVVNNILLDFNVSIYKEAIYKLSKHDIIEKLMIYNKKYIYNVCYFINIKQVITLPSYLKYFVTALNKIEDYSDIMNIYKNHLVSETYLSEIFIIKMKEFKNKIKIYKTDNSVLTEYLLIKAIREYLHEQYI